MKSKQKVLCNICTKSVRGNAKAVCCDFCNNWVHIKCNYITSSKYAELCEEENNESFLCAKCFNNELPYGSQNDIVFNQSVAHGLDDSNLDNLKLPSQNQNKKQ